jgi:Rab GDP dissociation inhibitor
VLYDGAGKVTGIKATMKERGEEGDGMKFETKCKKILADPSYFSKKVQVTGHLVKAICILNHPIDKMDSADSLQLIIPQSQVGRRHGTLSSTSLWEECILTLDRYLRSNGLLNPQRLP